MFLKFLLGRDEANPVEQRFKAVEREIDTVARTVSLRHRLLATRMKEIAINKPTEFMHALQLEDEVEKIAQIDRLIGKGVRLSPTDGTAPHFDQLLASTAEYGWAREACQNN